MMSSCVGSRDLEKPETALASEFGVIPGPERRESIANDPFPWLAFMGFPLAQVLRNDSHFRKTEHATAIRVNCPTRCIQQQNAGRTRHKTHAVGESAKGRSTCPISAT